MGQQQSIRYSAHREWLTGKGANTYTQFGEDGLIAAAIERIGETNRHCFEIGAADGVFFSNTLRLRQQGWYAVLIEGDDQLFEKLNNVYGEQSKCIHAWISDLDRVLLDTDIDWQPDLGVIDIDGKDFWMWHHLQAIRPRIMLVEISTVNNTDPAPPKGGSGQAGLDSIRALGEAKGYTLVAHTHCNALFIDSKENI